GGNRAGDQAGKELAIGGDVVGVGEADDGPAEQLVPVVADDLAEPWVRGDDVSAKIGFADADRRLLVNDAQAVVVGHGGRRSLGPAADSARNRGGSARHRHADREGAGAPPPFWPMPADQDRLTLALR